MAIHSSGQTVFSYTHKGGITLGASEEVDEVAGGVSGMAVDKIGEVDDRANEAQATGVFGSGFIMGSQAMVGARGGTIIKVSSDKESTEIGRMAEDD